MMSSEPTPGDIHRFLAVDHLTSVAESMPGADVVSVSEAESLPAADAVSVSEAESSEGNRSTTSDSSSEEDNVNVE